MLLGKRGRIVEKCDDPKKKAKKYFKLKLLQNRSCIKLVHTLDLCSATFSHT